MVRKPKAAVIARIAMLGALLYAAQVSLAFLPNIELVTLLIVIFTRNLGKEGSYACLVYTCLTLFTWGFGLWWVTYLVVWYAFSLVAYMTRRTDGLTAWLLIPLMNGLFGLSFGALFAVPYIFVSPSYALTYWINGIPFDIVHCIGNFAIAIVLWKPLDLAMKRIVRQMKINQGDSPIKANHKD